MNELLLRRRVAASKSTPIERSYIQDGLIFQLDGSQEIVSNSWTDLIGGVVFTANGFTKGTYGYSIVGKGAKTTSDLSFPYDTSTLEIVCVSPPRSIGKQVFYCGKQNMISFQFYQGTVITKIPSGKKYPYTTDSKMRSFSNSKNGFYINSSPITSTGTDSISISGAGTSIGAKYNGSEVYGLEIACIRIYNRVLSQSEVLFNVKIDNERFNLGLNIN